jgi:uncharacterized protein (TIGR03086 family)
MSPAEQHAQDAARFTALVESARGADWDRPSPVKEWTARGVVEHLIEWLPGFLGAADVSLPPVDTSDLIAAWRQRAADVQQLLETQGDREFEGRMIGRTTVADAIDRFYTADIWMHSWDLARALGQQIDMGEERCAAALAGMEPMEQVLRDSGQFGSRVDVPSDASAQDRFIGFIGRDPYWQPPS